MAKTAEDRIKDTFISSYGDTGGRNAFAIPWEKLFEFLSEILGGICPAAFVQRTARRNPDVVQERAAQWFKDEGFKGPEVKRLAGASVVTIQKAKLADLKAIAEGR